MDEVPTKNVLSEDFFVEGSISFGEFLELEGRVVGNIHSPHGTLKVGKEAEVEGKIEVDRLINMGKIQADVKAKRIDLSTSARLLGDLEVKVLSIEPGAFFSGCIKMHETS